MSARPDLALSSSRTDPCAKPDSSLPTPEMFCNDTVMQSLVNQIVNFDENMNMCDVPFSHVCAISMA